MLTKQLLNRTSNMTFILLWQLRYQIMRVKKSWRF